MASGAFRSGDAESGGREEVEQGASRSCAGEVAALQISPPLPLVRSLAYFLPVIEELRLNPPDLGYLTLLRARIATST